MNFQTKQYHFRFKLKSNVLTNRKEVWPLDIRKWVVFPYKHSVLIQSFLISGTGHFLDVLYVLILWRNT